MKKRRIQSVPLLALVLPLLVSAPTVRAAQTVTTVTADHEIQVLVDGELFTAYKFAPDQKLPYLYPVVGPLSGVSLTTETSEPYPHHHSIFFGCDRVNDGNYWQEGLERGQIRSLGARAVEHEDGTVVIEDVCVWVRPDAPDVFRDTRTLRISAPDPDLRVIDAEITLEALVDVRIEKTNHSLFSVRMAPEQSPASGGVLRNSRGDTGEDGTFGVRAPWAEMVTPSGTERIVLMAHPGNPWFPSPWFTRDYGFMSPTPMYWPANGTHTDLSAGASITLHYRVLVEGGDQDDASDASLERAWASYAQGFEPNAAQLQVFSQALEPVLGYRFGQDRAPLVLVRDLLLSSGCAPALRRAWVRLLEDRVFAQETSTAGRNAVLDWLALYGDDQTAERLTPGLRVPSIAARVCFAMAQLPSPRVDQVFAAEVEHAPHDLRLALISALAERRAETAIDPLSELVLHDDPETREAAAAALGRIGTPGATEALTEALGADTVGAHEPLIEALPVCAQHLVRGQHTTAARSVVTLLRDLDLAVPQQAALLNLDVAVNGRDALPRVLDALHSDTELRGLAVAAARALPAGSEVDLALARLLESPAPEARVVVVRLLEDRGATSAVGVLADTAGSDPDTTVRATALLALGSLGDLSCLELLIRCAQEQEPGIAAAAAEALARVGGEGVDSALIGKLRTGESVPELNAVAQAVVARGLAQAVEVLIERARADDPDLAETCARGLVDLATEQDLPAVVALHAELKDGGVIRQVERALLRIVGASHDRERVAAVLGQALETGPTTARPALVQALARVGTDAAFKGVMAQRQAESEDVRKAVIQALAESQRVDAVPALEASAREDASLVNRILALRAALDLSLARSDLTADDMVTRLGGFMELAERVEEQRMILGLLPRYPTDTAIAMAESLQQDADLADAAARAVEAIRQARLSKSFDFQPRNAPLAQGFIEVTVDTDFTPDRGFGWLSRPQDARDRQTGDELRRDFLFSPRPCTFRVSVAPGLYEVLVWIGDMTLSHDNVAVYAEGAKVLSGLTDSAGQVLEERFEVSVNDGALEIEFRDEGGTDANACIAGLRVRRLDDVGN